MKNSNTGKRSQALSKDNWRIITMCKFLQHAQTTLLTL